MSRSNANEASPGEKGIENRAKIIPFPVMRPVEAGVMPMGDFHAQLDDFLKEIGYIEGRSERRLYEPPQTAVPGLHTRYFETP